MESAASKSRGCHVAILDRWEGGTGVQVGWGGWDWWWPPLVDPNLYVSLCGPTWRPSCLCLQNSQCRCEETHEQRRALTPRGTSSTGPVPLYLQGLGYIGLGCYLGYFHPQISSIWNAVLLKNTGVILRAFFFIFSQRF